MKKIIVIFLFGIIFSNCSQEPEYVFNYKILDERNYPDTFDEWIRGDRFNSLADCEKYRLSISRAFTDSKCELEQIN